jgi:ABC-2 type transport system ATP-binding protein
MMDDSVPQPAIEAIDLTKRFGDRAAVDQLSLRVSAGTTLGFIGPNGAGKTTTIKMLMGMLRPGAGAARVLGADVLSDPAEMKQRVGYVPEMHCIYRWMRVRDVITFCRGIFRRWDDRRCEELLKLFQLESSKRVKQLSKGMLAMLSLALALSHEPEVLILDEPTSGLDPLVREEFLDGVLRVLCDKEMTVLFSSHTLSDVQLIADHVALIHEGRLLAHGATEDLVAGTKRIRVVLADGCAPGEPPEGTIWQRIERREWLLTVHGFSTDTLEYLRARYSVENVEVGNLGLEEVFKDFVKGQRASR